MSSSASNPFSLPPALSRRSSSSGYQTLSSPASLSNLRQKVKFNTNGSHPHHPPLPSPTESTNEYEWTDRDRFGSSSLPLSFFRNNSPTTTNKAGSMTTTATNHMMKNSKRGRPFVKDVHDLFSTLIVSLDLDTHRQFFKSYPNSFTTDEACLNLSSLKFSQSNRAADPKDPARIITTTTTTTFTMSREMAKDMCQHFIDARLIENAADPTSGIFKDRGVYMITAKGLHILERFVAKNGISQNQLLKVFASQPICMKLLHLERRSTDDELYTSRHVIEMLWRRFVGRSPNLLPEATAAALSSNPSASNSASRFQSTESIDQTSGIAVRPLNERIKGKMMSFDYTMTAMAMVDWLLDFTTMAQREEAVENGAQFVRHGFVELVSEKGRINKETCMIITVRGKDEPGIKAEAEFRATDKAVYRITDHGARSARWSSSSSTPGRGTPPPSDSSNSLSSQANKNTTTSQSSPSYNDDRPSREVPHDERYQGGLRLPAGGGGMDPKLMDRMDLSDRARTEFLENELKDRGGFNALKESHTTKLTQILEEPALRSLFREFLRSNFCEENLNYWLDVQDFKRRFSTSSSAAAGPGARNKTGSNSTMEKHHQDLIGMAFVIYNGYLAPHSPSELNIDHNLRGELVAYVTKNLPEAAAAQREAALKLSTNANDLTAAGQLPQPVGQTMHASQLQTMLRMYERIQTYIFRLMATDSVPKFCKTERFLALMRSVQEWTGEPDPNSNIKYLPPTSAPKQSKAQMLVADNDRANAYLTISQAANEKHAAATKAAAAAAASSNNGSNAALAN